jgi:hypothetical protein
LGLHKIHDIYSKTTQNQFGRKIEIFSKI